MAAARSSGHQDEIPTEGHGEERQQDEPIDVENSGNRKEDVHPVPLSSAPPKSQPKPGFLMNVLTKFGLDAPTLKAMFKGAIAPVVGLAIYQADDVARQFSIFGYLVGVVAALSLSVLPRGKFVQTLILNLLFLCIGSAISLLALWSALQARLHTQLVPDDPHSPPTYNSSQAAVSAIWLFANIWVVNILRAKYPVLNIPSIIYSILISVTCTTSVQVGGSRANFESTVRALLTSMLTGCAIAAATSLIILPTPSRAVSTAQFKGTILLLQGVLKQEKEYLQSLEREDMFDVPADITASTHTRSIVDDAKSKSRKKNEAQPEPKTTAEANAIKATMFSLRLLAGKIYMDLPFAKRDIAWAKLAAKDLVTIMELLRSVVVPIQGIGTVIDIFQRLAEKRGWITTSETPLDVLAEKIEDKRVWNEVMKQLHHPFEELSVAISEGLQHAGMLLEILPRPKSSKKGGNQADSSTTQLDVESKGNLIQPGDPGFAEALKAKIKSFSSSRGVILYAWAKETGLITTGSSLDEMKKNNPLLQPNTIHSSDQEQLYVLLYIETLMEAAGEAVLRFVQFADCKVADGTMARNRLIVPKPRVLLKWIKSVFNDEDKHQENNGDLFDSGLAVLYTGDGFALKRDPEHLPPTNFWQRAGNVVRAVPRFFSSEESTFGFRCACATLTVGIVAFLEQTHHFFQEQRLVWALVIIAIGMTQTSGQSIYGFFCRIFGTFVALVFSLITWYIVDEKVPGIFVFLYIFMAISIYFLLKLPQFIPAVMICMITQILVVGYELQVFKIGKALSESTGQPFYPIYELGPYRLATVAGGCLVAFFWTIFPSPLTERTLLRRDLAATLYLLANYFSLIHETLRSKHNGTGGDRNVKGTPAHHLAKHRLRLFGKLMLLLPSLQQHADFQRWEPTIGGKFPRKLYDDIIQRASRINSYLTLLSYTISGGGKGGPGVTITDSFNAATADSNSSLISENKESANKAYLWRDALAVLLADLSPTQHSIISSLTLLSNALLSGHSIPPHLEIPRPYELTHQLNALNAAIATTHENKPKSSDSDHDDDDDDDDENDDGVSIMQAGTNDMRSITQAGYAEFAVLQVCSTLVCDELEGIIESVSKLVGVVDFSYSISLNGAGANRTGSKEKGKTKLN
ncbi:hypothetical protein GGS21DRAFT_198709 [Xylaria nigripes]|nr:hypothetical protein GGS21DRAFT_198709 [Xylaria nigripes]